MFGKSDFFIDPIDAFQDRDGTGSVDFNEEWKSFTGDGSTTEFDCEINIDRINVIVNGYTMSLDDYDKDDTKIKFNDAPDDGAEIRCWILKKI